MKSRSAQLSLHPPPPSPSTTSDRSGGDDAPFAYADYVEAKSALLRALRGQRFYGRVVGASGMGKTYLQRDISAELVRHHQFIYLSSSRTSVVGIARLLARRLHLSPRRGYLETVQVLAETIRAHTCHLVLWLDDADQLDAATLKPLRMLVEADAVPLFSVVLCGLPPLLTLLDSPGLFPLKRRLTVECTLSGLRRDELEPFLRHRFGSADTERIPEGVLDDLFERTQAAPALIDRVLRQVLFHHPGAIDADEVRAVLDTAGL